MHITIDEAIAILDSWKTGETLFDVHVSIAGHGRKFQATVISIRGEVVSLSGSEGETEADLAGATFNGDRRASANSHYGAYLICEYGNGDFWSFYAPRRLGIQSSIPSIALSSAMRIPPDNLTQNILYSSLCDNKRLFHRTES
jgi:hypothetical protein